MEQLTLENQKIKKAAIQRKITASSENSQTEGAVDPLLFSQFEEFLELGPKTKFNKIHSITYLKTALEDDVLPCLRFGGNPKISGKKFIEPILTNTCFVEEMSPAQVTALQSRDANYSAPGSQVKIANEQPVASEDIGIFPVLNNISDLSESSDKKISNGKIGVFSRISEAISNASQTVASFANSTSDLAPGCSTCGNASEPYKYQFKITDVTMDLWYPICLACRSRIVAVCNFYNFVRHVRQGLYSSRKKEDIFLETVKLKRAMFLTRVGASATSSGPGLAPNSSFTESTIEVDSLLNTSK
jgi:hypothetical protein